MWSTSLCSLRQTSNSSCSRGIASCAGISIDAVLQREADEVSGDDGNQTDLIIPTHDTIEGTLNTALTKLKALPTVLAPIVRIRKEELA